VVKQNQRLKAKRLTPYLRASSSRASIRCASGPKTAPAGFDETMDHDQGRGDEPGEN
jgi:hypothetical protein